ncbi:MAG: hypothetical protein LBS58_03960 [Coriobacteriales bacterium]|jgi:hypothetical protein|nr:hypothetical protein [Coriobacteriales bacterium]
MSNDILTQLQETPANLVVIDEEINGAGTTLESFASTIAFYIDQYLQIIDYVTTAAIVDQSIVSSIMAGVAPLRGLSAQLNSLGTEYRGTCSEFVSAIDEADEFLY